MRYYPLHMDSEAQVSVSAKKKTSDLGRRLAGATIGDSALQGSAGWTVSASNFGSSGDLDRYFLHAHVGKA